MLDRTKKLSPHFTLGELTKTSYKTADGNEPTEEAIRNLENLCKYWLEDLRYYYNRWHVIAADEDYDESVNVEPIIINQGYRSQQVMQAMIETGLSPSPTSNHLTGCAVDIRCMGPEHAVQLMNVIIWIANAGNMDYDELILERRTMRSESADPTNYVYWLHFAARPQNNRRKILFLRG